MTLKIPEKTRRVITYGLFPLLLALYPFIGIREGVDVVDTTYSLTMFAYPEKLNAMWRLAYYLPNVIGGLVSRLPGGDTLAGMNAFGAAVIALTALTAYFFTLRLFPGNGSVGHAGDNTGDGSAVQCINAQRTVLCVVPCALPTIIFLAELIAISLCWCPRVILYNYLTYLFMTVGVVLLLGGLQRNPVSGFTDNTGDGSAVSGFIDTENRSSVLSSPTTYLLLAGLALGINVHVRFPNIAEAAFILIVWFDAWQKKETLSAGAKKTLACVAGYAAGFGVPMLIILLRYGAGAYADMLSALFGMTDSAQDYSAGGMLTAIIATYGRSIVKMWPVWVAIAAGVMIEMMLLARRNADSGKQESVEEPCDTDNTVDNTGDGSAVSGLIDTENRSPVLSIRIIHLLLCLIAMLYMYKTNIFTRSYWYYDSIFEPAMMFLILGVVVCVTVFVYVRKPDKGTGAMSYFSTNSVGIATDNEKPDIAPVLLSGFSGKTVPGAPTLALTTLLIIFITPLGSNNYTYPLINNLFLVAPMILSMVYSWITDKKGSARHNMSKVACVRMTLSTATICVAVLLLFQGTLFHTRYSFNDGTDSTVRDTVITQIPRANGMKTTEENAAALTSLYEELASYRAAEAQTVADGGNPEGMIQFGRAPGLPYLMEIEPAIFTTWPDLDTVSPVEFRQSLHNIGFPLIIIKKDPLTGEPDITGEVLGLEKWEILQEFMLKKGYMKKSGSEDKPFWRHYDVYFSYASSRALH